MSEQTERATANLGFYKGRIYQQFGISPAPAGAETFEWRPVPTLTAEQVGDTEAQQAAA